MSKGKENILDLNKYIDKRIRVSFMGGREVTGILKGYDQLLNLVLDDTIEYLQGPDGEDPLIRIAGENNENEVIENDNYKRKLGLMVARGHSVMVFSPIDGTEEIPNPFAQQQEIENQEI
eukprot:TRINITY_DN1913_c0_g1_i1.p1 TRINITY_DN1913_c0_g1~~TRINITY_DN1913_c0_g1_i1.p1  ORF type:complete len:127 (-),score=54.79 TRINITY_DN1913_c0_g1_i1:232-591(-)